MTDSKTRLHSVMQVIKSAEQRANRSQGSVKLLAVSKTWPAARLRELAEAGQIAFGENYLQESLEKMSDLQDLQLEWHFIGPVQSNKTRELAARFDWVESVDRLKIAQRLSAQRPQHMPALNICLQVNLDNEPSKSGITTDQLMHLADAVSQRDHICLRGLMVIPAFTDNVDQQLQTFGRAHQLFELLQARFPSVDTLSMGMSGDMQAAVIQGSTQVRIGTALFGDRHTLRHQ